MGIGAIVIAECTGEECDNASIGTRSLTAKE